MKKLYEFIFVRVSVHVCNIYEENPIHVERDVMIWMEILHLQHGSMYKQFVKL